MNSRSRQCGFIRMFAAPESGKLLLVTANTFQL